MTQTNVVDWYNPVDLIISAEVYNFTPYDTD